MAAIVSLPQSKTKDKQIIHFQELEYPISLGKSIQLENISNRILKQKAEDKRYTQYNLLELLKKATSDNDLEKRHYYFVRTLILISRSLHNLSLPLMGIQDFPTVLSISNMVIFYLGVFKICISWKLLGGTSCNHRFRI